MTRQTSRNRSWQPAALALAGAAAAFCAGAAQAQETFKVGIVSFLSGQAAESFGIPAVNGAKVLVDAFNKGAAPAPYNKVGFGGMKIEAVYVDENGGATKQVQELRNLYDREKVDAVVGYVGSGDCLAVAPVAEEMKRFLILYDCGTPRIFEDNKLQYVFRTASHAAMDNVALARYLKARNVKVESFNLINQDYAWGQDSKKDFTCRWRSSTRRQAGRGPAAQVRRRPVRHRDLGADGQAGRRDALEPVGRRPAGFHPAGRPARSLQANAGRLLGRRPRPARPRRQDARRRDPRCARRLRLMSPKSALNDWWWDLYSKAYNTYPVQAPYRMVQSLLGLKLAVEKAMAANGGKKPTGEQLAAALTGLEWDSPAGRIRMALGDGHQAIQDTAIGKTRYDAAKKMVVLEDIQRFPADCVNPAGEHEVGGLDQGRLPRRQGLPVARARSSR
jgi:branched-chain amino acid transport system substrate-binding protein